MVGADVVVAYYDGETQKAHVVDYMLTDKAQVRIGYNRFFRSKPIRQF